MVIFHNYPLIAAITAIILAQVIKVPLYYITIRSWDWGLFFSSGGMPSSHSAAVASLSTSIGIVEGIHSSSFAISVVMSAIIMFDAAGIRRHAGEQAAVLNRLIEEFDYLFQELKTLKTIPPSKKGKVLKELLGHRPLEVIMGGIFGILSSLCLYLLFF